MPERSTAEATRVADLRGAGPVRAGALELARLTLSARESGPCRTAEAEEHLLYVIRGSGTARVGGDTIGLARESVLWLEAAEAATLVAGADGLELLSARAPS